MLDASTGPNNRNMFEDYIFDLNVYSDSDDMPDDPPISPTSSSAFLHNGHYSLAAAAPTGLDVASNANLFENESVDRLAHELDERASISGRQARRPQQKLAKDRSVERRSESLAGRHALGRDAVPITSYRMQPPVNREACRASFRQRAETQPDIAAAAGGGAESSLEATYQSKRLRRQTDPRPQQQQNNPCLENLLTTMVEHNVQCNVQSSGPEPTPMLTSRPSLLRISSSVVPSGCGSGLAVFDDLMPLEVDANYCEGEDDALLNDTVALRDAGAPAGVKKHGGLRYRTSADVGGQYRNMKRNVPRMRRRPKTKTHAPPAVPAGATTT